MFSRACGPFVCLLWRKVCMVLLPIFDWIICFLSSCMGCLNILETKSLSVAWLAFSRLNWCFWTVVLGKTLESTLDCKRSKQSILKEISPGCSLERLKLELKLQYFGHLMRRADSLEKTLMLERLKAGGEGDDRGWDGWISSSTWWTCIWVDSGSWWWTGRPGMLQSMGSKRVRHDWATELNWTDCHFAYSFLHCAKVCESD